MSTDSRVKFIVAGVAAWVGATLVIIAALNGLPVPYMPAGIVLAGAGLAAIAAWKFGEREP